MFDAVYQIRRNELGHTNLTQIILDYHNEQSISNFTEKQVKKLTKIFSKSYLTQVQGGLSKNTDDYLKIYLIEELLFRLLKLNIFLNLYSL